MTRTRAAGDGAIAGLLLEGLDDPAAIQAALRHVRRDLRASNASLSIVHGGRGGDAGLYCATDIDAELVEAYLPHMHEDPWYSALRRRTGVACATGPELVPDREMRRSWVYANFNRRAGLDHVATAAVLGGDIDVMLIANGSRQRGDFDRTALVTLRALLGHATRFARLRAILQGHAAQVRPDATFHIDASGAYDIDRATLACLMASPHVRIRGRTVALDGASGPAFELACALARQGLSPPRAVFELACPDGTLCLEVLPARRRSGERGSRWVARIGVQTREGPPAGGRHAAVLAGLTAAEHRLLVALVSGSSPQAYASAIHRSINTVRTHLKHLLAKTGCRRQADLVRMFIGLASDPRDGARLAGPLSG